MAAWLPKGVCLMLKRFLVFFTLLCFLLATATPAFAGKSGAMSSKKNDKVKAHYIYKSPKKNSKEKTPIVTPAKKPPSKPDRTTKPDTATTPDTTPDTSTPDTTTPDTTIPDITTPDTPTLPEDSPTPETPGTTTPGLPEQPEVVDSTLITAYGASTERADNADAINKAINSASLVVIPEGIYKIQSAVRLENGLTLEGTRGSSIILIDDTFKKGRYFPENEFAILNKDFSQSYDGGTVDRHITIRGITFVMNKTNTDSIATILGLANVENVIIEDCDFIIENNRITGNNIDLYAACKNVTISNCFIKNDTGAEYGAGIMVRCLTDDGYDTDNETAGVLIENNSLEKNGNDEAIAVWGCVGQVRDVVVQNNSIEAYGRVPDVIIDAFAGEFNRYSTARTENVVFDGNTITTEDIAYTIFQVGQNTDTVSRLDNVSITNNTINAKVSATGYTTVIKSYGQDNYTNILIDSNRITNTGSVNICYGISGKGMVSNNEINGLFNASIAYGATSYQNTINDNTKGAAFENVAYVDSNIINNCLVGIKCFETGNYSLTNNIITMMNSPDSFGIQALNVMNSYPVVSESNNNIIKTNQSSIAMFSNGGEIV
jgi:hypothetical protein